MEAYVRGTNDRTFSNPVPDVLLGDPFVLRHRGRFYLYGTNEGPPLPDGRVIPVYRSDDLLSWEPLGGALVPREPEADHRSPEVLYWNGRFFMVVSYGDNERRGHALWVAVAERPEGPFRLVTRISDPSERSSIDGSWLLDDDGRLYLYRCLDFTNEDDPPNGTAIVVQRMRNPQTPATAPVPVIRASAPWQLFEANRTMPLYEGRTFAEWTAINGPTPVRRGGRVFCGYSAGNDAGIHGTGEAVADHPLGPYTDPRSAEGPVLGTVPGLVEGPGHFSVVRPDLVHDWIVLHGRRPGEPSRRVWLCPVRWEWNGIEVGPLTDQPQPAPPLPTEVTRFADCNDLLPAGWRTEGDGWSFDGGLRSPAYSASESHAWRDAIALQGDWAVEAWVRFLDTHAWEAGLVVDSGANDMLIVSILPAQGVCSVFGAQGSSFQVPLPVFGSEPFDPKAFHRIEIRVEGGLADIRLDDVLVCGGVGTPEAPARLGLVASGPAVFDAVSITTPSGPKT